MDVGEVLGLHDEPYALYGIEVWGIRRKRERLEEVPLELLSKEAAMAKWYGDESVIRVIRELLPLFGWQGYSVLLPVEQRFRDAMNIRIGDGTAEIMKLIIAREILGHGFGPVV